MTLTILSMTLRGELKLAIQSGLCFMTVGARPSLFRCHMSAAVDSRLDLR